MIYAKVPVTNGIMEIGYGVTYIRSLPISDMQAIIQVPDGTPMQFPWILATRSDWDDAYSQLYKSLSLQDAINLKIQQLQDDSDDTVSKFQSSALGSPHTYLADLKSMAYLSAKYQLVTGPHYDGNPFNWYTVESEFVQHTGDQIIQVFLDGDKFVTHQKSVLFARKITQVKSCTSVDQLKWVQWNDMTPPNTPTGLADTLSGSTINFTWNQNTEPDMMGYNLYQNGMKINASLITNTNYTLSPSTTGSYQFTVTAIDTDGNESTLSTPITVDVVVK